MFRRTGHRDVKGAVPISRIVLDGKELQSTVKTKRTIPLVDDRRDHWVEVEFG